MTNTNDSLARAIDTLGAVEVAPGRYAWKRFDGWITGGTLQVEHAAYDSHAFAAKPKLMPAWWSPEQRFAWRVTGYGYDLSVRYRTQGEALAAPCDYPQTFDGTGQPKRTARRITADLETGAEVPA